METKHKLRRENLHGKRKHGFQLDALLVNVVGILENQMSMIQKKKQLKRGTGGLIMEEVNDYPFEYWKYKVGDKVKSKNMQKMICPMYMFLEGGMTMSLEGWIDWLSLDNEELLLDKSERAELLELLLELRKFREAQDEDYDDFLNDREREC